ncbi:hypothetical protein R1flu_013879 [Riccia fluitans]|uniref:Uncharacterized protein n=1 Tax=Riccia fluitans TaxID=41844 RepID=A0ABD1YEH7_9MARC
MVPAPEIGAGAGAEAEAKVSRASTPLLPAIRTTTSNTKITDTILPLEAIESSLTMMEPQVEFKCSCLLLRITRLSTDRRQ